MNRNALIRAILCALAISTLPAVEPQDLQYLTEDYAPSNYVENGKLTGIAVEILRAVWSHLGVPEQNIRVLPWARGYAMVKSEPNTVLFAMTRSPAREPLFKWVGRIYRGNYTLYSDANRPVVLNNLDEAKNYRIGVIREDFSEKDLQARAFPDSSIVPVDSAEQLIRMLFLGRGDLLYLYDDTVKAFAPTVNAKAEDFYHSIVVSSNVLYYAFSKGTDDAIVNRFQKALDAVDSERRAIVTRYGGTP